MTLTKIVGLNDERRRSSISEGVTTIRDQSIYFILIFNLSSRFMKSEHQQHDIVFIKKIKKISSNMFSLKQAPSPDPRTNSTIQRARR